MTKSGKKYNHAFTIAFSIDSDMPKEEWYKKMGTKEGIMLLGAHCIKRVQDVINTGEVEAFDLWDSCEN